MSTWKFLSICNAFSWIGRVARSQDRNGSTSCPQCCYSETDTNWPGEVTGESLAPGTGGGEETPVNVSAGASEAFGTKHSRAEE